MMLDAETRAVYLAEAQLERRSYMTPDPDERVECDAVECAVCTKPLVGTIVWHAAAKKFVTRKPTTGQTVCRECSQNGWRSKPCVSCFGPTKSWSWSSKARRVSTRGMCDKCRAEWHRDNPANGAGNTRARYMVTA
jgi:hypothetical protein